MISDAVALQALYDAVELAEINKVALETALQSHPVTKFVKELPCEDLYKHVQQFAKKNPAISETYHTGKVFRLEVTDRHIRTSDMVDESRTNTFWTLPAHDGSSKSCGVKHLRSESDRAIVTCSNDPHHYAAAISGHCWRLNCKNCMNSTALRMGVKAEGKILAPIDIKRRSGDKDESVGHWVLSPPQEWAIYQMVNSKRFVNFFDSVIRILKVCGITSGAIVFHPWRQQNFYDRDHQLNDDIPEEYLDQNGDLLPEYEERRSYWKLGPHFHIVGTGYFLKTEAFRRFMDLINQEGFWNDETDENWIIKKIHSGQAVRSVRQTVAYLLTHAGIGSYDYDENIEDIFDDLVIPVTLQGNSRKVKECSIIQYNADWETSGWVAEHLNEWTQDDWIDWTKKKFTGRFQTIRYLGECTTTRVLATYRERAIRECPDCGSPLVRYQSSTDTTPEEVEYFKESIIRVKKDRYQDVKDFLAKYKGQIWTEGETILTIAMAIPFCSTPETQGVQSYTESKTQSERVQIRGRKLVYFSSRHGQGLDPIMMSAEEYRFYKRTGRKPERVQLALNGIKLQEI